MREFIYDSWNGIMNANINPLRHIPDTNTRHMVLQVLAWMWCIVFSMYVGSIFVMGVTMIAHVIFLAAIVVTVATFKVAERSPSSFNFLNGYHSLGRNRSYTMYRDKHGKLVKVYLPKGDPGGEHE